jgi:hypothetical protein
MRDYHLKLRDADAPPIIVPSYSVETYFALGEEQAEKEHVKRCISPELPDNHHVYSVMHSLPERLYESKERDWGSTIWKIRKELAEDVVKRLGLDKTDYPYKEALDMIDGDFFWIIAWDD